MSILRRKDMKHLQCVAGSDEVSEMWVVPRDNTGVERFASRFVKFWRETANHCDTRRLTGQD